MVKIKQAKLFSRSIMTAAILFSMTFTTAALADFTFQQNIFANNNYPVDLVGCGIISGPATYDPNKQPPNHITFFRLFSN